MRVITIITILILIAVGYWYFIQPAFREIEIDDALPIGTEVFQQAAVENQAVDIQEEPVVVPVEKEVAPVVLEQPVTTETRNPVVDMFPALPVPEVEEKMEQPQATITERVALTGTPFHPVDGYARIVITPDGKRFLRYENLDTIDGPRLHVYLMADLGGNDVIDLGERKGTNGNINYEIPEGVDLEKYKYAAHWCVPFSVLFNYADISNF